MGLDSVELVLCWESALERQLPESEVTRLRTPAETISYLALKMDAISRPACCLRQRGFHHVRKCLIEQFSVDRLRIQPAAELRLLLPNHGRRKVWSRFQSRLDLGSLTSTVGRPLLGAGRTTVRDIVIECVACRGSRLLPSGERWSRSQIREIVRSSISFVTGDADFLDSDRFNEDLGID